MESAADDKNDEIAVKVHHLHFRLIEAGKRFSTTITLTTTKGNEKV